MRAATWRPTATSLRRAVQAQVPAGWVAADEVYGADPALRAAISSPSHVIFHCYIDLLWAKWQPNHTTDTDLDARLCRLFKDRDHLEEHCIHVNDTLNGEGVVGVARGPAVLDDRDGDEVLQGISFTASPGRMVALVGSSGVRLRP
jgi:ABC-type multidrug transport system fused ATPase/permease subunit